MKIVIGADHTAESLGAAEMIARLQFEGADVEVVHVLERIEPLTFGELPPDAELIDRLLKRQEEEGRGYLARAQEALARHRVAARSSLRTGFSANELMESARLTDAKLIAVGCEGKGSVEGLLYGSVSRKLAVSSPTSVLITKRAELPPGPLTAVLATDHSDYFNRCVDLLLQMRPRGLAKITVVTAYPRTLIGAMRSVMEHFKGDVGAWVEKNLEEQNQALIKRLEPLGAQCTSRVVDAAPDAAIEQTMQETGATLLMLGAQGHGFLDRITAGSVSFQQAVKSPYDTLLLRV